MRELFVCFAFAGNLFLAGCANMVGFGAPTEGPSREEDPVNSQTSGVADSIIYTVRQKNPMNDDPATLQLTVESPVLWGKPRFYKIDDQYLIGCPGKHWLRIYILRRGELTAQNFFDIVDSAEQRVLELPLPPIIRPGDMIRLRGECQQS